MKGWIAKIPDRSSQLLEVASFEKTVLNKEAEALKVGLDVIAKADSFVPRVVQIKSTIIIIKEGRIPPTIPPVPTPTTTVGPASALSTTTS